MRRGCLSLFPNRSTQIKDIAVSVVVKALNWWRKTPGYLTMVEQSHPVLQINRSDATILLHFDTWCLGFGCQPSTAFHAKYMVTLGRCYVARTPFAKRAAPLSPFYVFYRLGAHSCPSCLPTIFSHHPTSTKKKTFFLGNCPQASHIHCFRPVRENVVRQPLSIKPSQPSRRNSLRLG